MDGSEDIEIFLRKVKIKYQKLKHFKKTKELQTDNTKSTNQQQSNLK